jgi:hypothetical protein
MKDKDLIQFSTEEAHELDRANIAWELGKFPAEVDAQPVRDIEVMLAIKRVNDKKLGR